MIHLIAIPWLDLLLPFGVSLAISLGLLPFILKFAKHHKLFDLPGGRRIHSEPTPRIGGVAIFLALLLPLLIFFKVPPQLYGIYLGLISIFTLGILDDLYELPAWTKLVGQVFAASITIFFGITISNLTNPFGGTILLSPFVDVILTLVWILLIVNTVNFLDGLDGLAAGISGIASFILIVLSLFTIVNQPDTASMAAIVLGAALGFLYYNWHPAKIFMGDSGSHILGYMIAILSIISGGKVATAALVLGFPILDVAWSVVRRLGTGRHPFSADRMHLHHRLLDMGLTQPQTVTLFYLLSSSLGVIALISGTLSKLIWLVVTIVAMWLIVRFTISRNQAQQK